jgi:16S rRNA (cytidine1402-2'-O)-methyltransferase
MLRGSHDPRALRHADARRGIGVTAARARAHFDEHERAAIIAHDEIDLAAATAHVARDEPHALALQKLERAGLEDIAERFGHGRSVKVVMEVRGKMASFTSLALAHALMLQVSELADGQQYPTGALYVVATPIGNAADITVRALHVLELVDRVAAEDTRNTSQLLARYGISKPSIAVHEHNERSAAERVIAHLKLGERIACVSDAGTPGISDPGARLVDAVREAGFPVIPLPGASALTTALSAAGAFVAGFSFIGFLPTKAKQRASHLRTLVDHPMAMVFYEAPHRIVETVRALADAFGPERQILIARELTKLHESLHRCTLAEGPKWLEEDANRQRGEFVLVVEGAPETEDADDAHDALLATLLEELSVKSAAKIAATLTGASRNVLYERALALAKRDKDAE